MQADSSLVPRSLETSFNGEALFNKLNVVDIGIMSGGALIHVFQKNFFVFGSAMPGVGLNFGMIGTEDNYKPDIGPMLRFNTKVAFGYANDKIYTMASYASNLALTKIGHGNRYNYNHATFKLIFEVRIGSKVKMLEKINES